MKSRVLVQGSLSSVSSVGKFLCSKSCVIGLENPMVIEKMPKTGLEPKMLELDA